MSLTRMLQLGAVALAAVALAAGPASAKTGGSSANANLCKKGGWQNLFTAPPIKDFDTGVPFKNQGDCVSYAVHGGTPSTADQLAERACQTFGGTFNSDYPETIPPYILWTCVGTQKRFEKMVPQNCKARTKSRPPCARPSVVAFLVGDAPMRPRPWLPHRRPVARAGATSPQDLP